MRNGSRIERLWRRELTPFEAAIWTTLTPLSFGYASLLRVRSRWWRSRARDPMLPTVSVGNLTVGGNGKTPFTLFLAERLDDRGYRCGIASRGYGRARSRSKAILIADRGRINADVADAGDEPSMLAHRFDGPIAVAQRRMDAIELLAHSTDADVVILDDGFQHQRLLRDLDVVVINSRIGFGNGWVLPAGPLREPLSAIARAEAIVLIETPGVMPTSQDLEQSPMLRGRKILRARIEPTALIRVAGARWIAEPIDLRGRRVAAVSGIAQPERFTSMLRELGADIVNAIAYPDHHAYTARDRSDLEAAAAGADLLVTTEKDLVKLQTCSPALPKLCAVRLEVAMNASDETELMEMIINRIERKRDRRPGVRADKNQANCIL